jgi:hypothetical protein
LKSFEECEQKIASLVNYFHTTDQSFIFQADWLKILQHFQIMMDCSSEGKEPDLSFEAFDDNRIFQIVWHILSSVIIKSSLRDALSKQVTAVSGLVDYGFACRGMMPGIGKMIHEFWLNVSCTRRFLLHNPQDFADEMNSISPKMGGRTIIKVIRGASLATKIGIPVEIMENLEKLETL